jgi:transcriptional regulator with XRE-family HTH domain
MRRIPALARLRGRRGWTARDLARRADIADETVSRIENGHQPSTRTIYKLATALEMGFDELAALLTEEADEASA